MKFSAALIFAAGVLELTTASLYTSMIVKKFKGEEYWSSDYLPGKNLRIDLDQVRFELGGCTYAAFCVSFIGESSNCKSFASVLCFSDMILAFGLYKKRGFEDLRFHQQEDKRLEEENYRTLLNQMGQQGQMPRTSEFEPYYTVQSGTD